MSISSIGNSWINQLASQNSLASLLGSSPSNNSSASSSVGATTFASPGGPLFQDIISTLQQIVQDPAAPTHPQTRPGDDSKQLVDGVDELNLDAAGAGPAELHGCPYAGATPGRCRG